MDFPSDIIVISSVASAYRSRRMFPVGDGVILTEVEIFFTGSVSQEKGPGVIHMILFYFILLCDAAVAV